jgi:membrane-bound inhibitor of C-type lysozyme
MCPEGSMHDRIAKDWSAIRSYVLREGRLYLSLMADGGIYEFEPLPGSSASPKSQVVAKGPQTYACTMAGKPAGRLEATFYDTSPALVLVTRDSRTRPAFSVPAASGARYEGEGVRFWEARGEVTVWWSGTELACRPN